MYPRNGYIWISNLTTDMKYAQKVRPPQTNSSHPQEFRTHKKYNEERKKYNFYILEINPCGPTFASNACFTN